MNWKRRIILILIGSVLIIAGITALTLSQADKLVDYLWFQSLGFGFYYLQRLFYPFSVLLCVTIVFFLLFYLNFKWALRRFGKNPLERQTEDPSKKSLLKRLKGSGIHRIFSLVALILALFVAWPFFEKWEMLLFYLFGPNAGYADTVFQKDISFYLFSLPIYQLIQTRLLYALLVFAVGLLFIYWMDHRKFSSSKSPLRGSVKFHFSIVLLTLYLFAIWDLVLQRFELIYTNAHEPLFSGPGAIEMRFLMPLIWSLVISLSVLVGTLIHFIYRRKGLGSFLGAAGLFVICLMARYSDVVPYMVNTYLIEANSVSWERPFIENNIKSTLAAYNLDSVEVRQFTPAPQPEDMASSQVKGILRNIPVWDDELLVDVFQQRQELRNYYNFSKVHVGRYLINGEKNQVFLAARELDSKNLPGASRNWVNRHLTFTHGYGAVMTSASQGKNNKIKWYIHGIPPRSEYGLNTEQPGIYYGLGQYDRAIAPNSANEIDYPQGNDNVLTHYDGEGGVGVGSFWRKILFSYYFDDRNIFWTTKTNPKSKILFHRNLTERIKKVTPYLHLDREPYLVVDSKRLYWIQDAYTVSSLFPYAASINFGNEKINYIRNSVKIVMDAYSGRISYYISDPNDPIAAAMGRIYPTVFKPLEELSDELKQHLRYPQDIFEIQMRIYAKYHQTNPEVFHQGEDIWEFAPTGMNKNRGVGKSYYAMVDLVQPGRLDFILMLPMISRQRQNLRALPIVSCNEENYGKIIIYNFPKGDLVYGPSQINALIDQDPYVAQQFTLWDQAGSQVERGKMIILMVGNTMLYVQPVYLQSTQLSIPELQRVIMSQGQTIVMKSSIEEAYEELSSRVAESEVDLNSNGKNRGERKEIQNQNVQDQINNNSKAIHNQPDILLNQNNKTLDQAEEIKKKNKAIHNQSNELVNQNNESLDQTEEIKKDNKAIQNQSDGLVNQNDRTLDHTEEIKNVVEDIYNQSGNILKLGP
ncbi:MAG: UPF0182 family protein [Desulfobacteraceae bacterium]|jgi:hypothetical protein